MNTRPSVIHQLLLMLGDDGDPYLSTVKLLMGFEGADGSTGAPGLTDESPAAHGLATSGASSTIETAQFKFGASSYRMHAVVGNSLVFNDSPDWLLSSANSDQFTVECWLRLASVGTERGIVTQYPFGAASNVSWGFRLGIANANELEFMFSTNGTTLTTITSSGAAMNTTLNTWVLVAVDKDAAGKIRIYKNGVMVGNSTPANSAFFNSTNGLGIMSVAANGNRMDGWIDELRISKGISRYASDSGYTVPTAAFPRV